MEEVSAIAVTSGPGATNLITGLATAYADSIPLVCITGQVDSSLLGSDVFQEADITGASESFVKYSYLVKDAEDIPRIMKEAFYIANTGRKGPVLIDVPIDVQNQVVSKFRYPDEIKMRTYKPTVKGNIVQVHKVGKELEKAKRPIICAGRGVFLSEAQEVFATKLYAVPLCLVKHELHIGQNIGRVLVGSDAVTHPPELLCGLADSFNKSKFLHVARRKCPVKIIDQGNYRAFSGTHFTTH